MELRITIYNVLSKTHFLCMCAFHCIPNSIHHAPSWACVCAYIMMCLCVCLCLECVYECEFSLLQRRITYIENLSLLVSYTVFWLDLTLNSFTLIGYIQIAYIINFGGESWIDINIKAYTFIHLVISSFVVYAMCECEMVKWNHFIIISQFKHG